MQRELKPVIEVRDLRKDFSIGKQTWTALRGVNLKIYGGEYVIIFGPSGCGKSTLLNMIAGLEPPSTGQVLIRGENIAGANAKRLTIHRREKIGIVFQQFNLLKTMSIVNNVALPGWFRNQGIGGTRKRAAELLRELGLGKVLTHRPNELSGGEQQRVAIARALFNNPWILLADEPTGNVDSKTADDIMELFYELNRRSKRTILLVTHNPDYLHFADRVLYMRDGQIVLQETQERTQREMESVELKRRAAKMARELHRSELEERARSFGMKPEDYRTELELADAILTHDGQNAKETKEPPEMKKKEKVIEPTSSLSQGKRVADHLITGDRLKEARRMSRRLHRSELDRTAVELGLNPKQYKNETAIAEAILEAKEKKKGSSE